MDQVAQQLDLQMRASALQLAVGVFQKSSFPEYTEQEITHMAQAFYQFLKGE
jgi:hypothetical protein